MVVVRIWGGTGNQLNLFCVGYVVSQYLKQSLCLDISYHVNGYFRPYILDMLSLNQVPKMIYRISDWDTDRNLKQSFDLEINLDYVEQREELFSLCEGHNKIYIYGDDSARFYRMEDITAIKNQFALRYRSLYFCNMCKNFSESESVAVHIRRTDMVDLNWVNDGEEIYYKAAVAYIRNKLIQPNIYFFSDDIQWVSKVFGVHKEFYYVKLVGGCATDVEELFLMAACKHHILTAQSTYSWWAAFLSPWTDGINISNGKVMPNEPVPNLIYFDDEITRRWYQKYLDYETVMGREIILDSDRLQRLDYIKALLMQGKNKLALQEIDMLAINRICMSPNDYDKLLELKSTALLREIYHGADGAKIEDILSIMDKLLPDRKNSFDFFCNYSFALYKAGRIYESVLYAANARRIKNDKKTFWWIGQDRQKLFWMLYEKLLQENHTHFVFLNIVPWSNIRCFYDSLEIILSNLGMQVTIFECFKDDSCRTSSFEEVMKSKKILDSVNHFGIEKYEMHCMKDDEYFLYAKDLIKAITEENKEIKIITHFAEGVMFAPYPVYYIDGYSKWDKLTYKYSKGTLDMICNLSAKIFTKCHDVFVCKDKVVDCSDTGFEKESDYAFDQDEKPYLNFDCYVRNQDMMKEIIWVIMNL